MNIIDKLKEKYGDKWMLVPLTDEELAQIDPPSKEEIRKAFSQMKRIVHLPIHPKPINSTRRYI